MHVGPNLSTFIPLPTHVLGNSRTETSVEPDMDSCVWIWKSLWKL